MKKAVILTSTLLFAACMAFAQSSTNSGDQSSSQPGHSMSTQSSTSSPTTSEKSAGPSETLRGCLSREGTDYFLTTIGPTRERYEITGDTSKLAAHVGHEVSITGSVQNIGSTAAGRNNNQGGMMGNGQGGMMGNGQGGNNQGGMMGNSQGGMMNTSPAGTILLKNFKHISTSCNPS
jgi:hypothetical protein